MMAYNAGWELSHPGYDNDTGCIEWPEAEWDDFEERVALPPERQGYFFVEDMHGTPLGHAHYWVTDDIAEIGFNIVPSRRRQGLGQAALALLLTRIWADTSVSAATNAFEDSRAAAVTAHRRAGFTPVGISHAQVRPTTIWRLDRPR